MFVICANIIVVIVVNSDPRVENWLLMSSPLPTAVLVTLYLLFVFIGPRIMRNRQPLNVKIPMLTYNLFMVGLSYYMFHEVGLYFNIYVYVYMQCSTCLYVCMRMHVCTVYIQIEARMSISYK